MENISPKMSFYQQPLSKGDNLVKRPRQFTLAVKSLYSQSLTSISTERLTTFGAEPLEQPRPPDQPEASQPETATDVLPPPIAHFKQGTSGRSVLFAATPHIADHVGYRGRGRPYIPQEVLDQPLRRPGASAPGQVASPVNDPTELYEFNGILTGLVDDFTVYKKMEVYIFKQARGLADLEKMIKFISSKALECTKNAPTVCKYLYVFSQDPSVRENLQTAFFGNLEKDFMGREDIKKREGPERYRNFIKWIMAVAHHFRNPLYAPFDELMLGLNALAREISTFNDPEDYSLFVQLNVRFYYYASLPCSNGKSVPALLGEQYSSAIRSARDTARRRLAQGSISTVQSHWLMLLLEVTRSSPEIDKDIVDYYKDVLPGFSQLLPSALTIKLPPNSGREKYLTHISQFIKS